MSQTKYCARHPRTPTNLACGKCGELVCPECMVHTPVGVRCSGCARVCRLPTFDVTTGTLVRAVAAGVVVSVALVVASIFLVPIILRIPFGFSIVMIGIGFLIGEAISASVNRKRGRALKFVSGGAALISVLAIVIILGGGSIFVLLSGAFAVIVSIRRF